MKKLKSFALMLLIFGATKSVSAQIGQGNFIIDPYYGYPNLGKQLAEGIDDATGDVTVGGIGPAGLRFEYMLADNFGLGFDFIYNSTNLNFQVDSLGSDGVTVVETYDVKSSMQRFRFHVRANYHFVQEDAFDAYVGFGAGTNNRLWKTTTDFPGYEATNTGATLFPVSMRIALGTRYYFTDNFGLNGEIGLGGPLVSAGLSLKF